MAGTKRAAPSRSSSPEAGSNKRARVYHKDETKEHGIQEKKVEEGQEEEPKDLKEYHEEATNHEEWVVNEDSSVKDEAGKDEEQRSQPTAVIDQSEPGVATYDNPDTSSGFSREGNDENLPLTYLEPQDPDEKDENPRLEDEVVVDYLGAAISARQSHDQSSSSSSKIGANKRALLELKVETGTDKEGMVLAGITATASDIVAEDPSCDSRSPHETAADTIITTVEPVDLVPQAASSTPATPSTEALQSTHEDPVGTAQQLSVSRARSPRSPTPSLDPRIALWKCETRSYAGRLTIERNKSRASDTARRASETPLFINGVPQLTFFVDGSIMGSSSRKLDQGWQKGGYRVAFRNPFDDTVEFSSRDEKPVRFLEKPRVREYQQGVDNNYILEEGKVYDGPSRVVDFTVLCFGSRKVFSVPQAELAAVSQAQETAIRFVDKHQPPTSVVNIFSDATGVIDRIEKGVVPDPPKGITLKLWTEVSNPLVRAVIWQSHYLRDRGCQLEIIWSPRCSGLGPALADAAANAWREWPEEELSQRQLALDVRDGMLDKLNEETNELIRKRGA